MFYHLQPPSRTSFPLLPQELRPQIGQAYWTGDTLCLVEAYDTYPVFHDGPPVNMDRYKMFARYSATLSYHNPFRFVSSTPLYSSTVNGFTAPQHSRQQAVPGQGSSGVNSWLFIITHKHDNQANRWHALYTFRRILEGYKNRVPYPEW